MQWKLWWIGWIVDGTLQQLLVSSQRCRTTQMICIQVFNWLQTSWKMQKNRRSAVTKTFHHQIVSAERDFNKLKHPNWYCAINHTFYTRGAWSERFCHKAPDSHERLIPELLLWNTFKTTLESTLKLKGTLGTGTRTEFSSIFPKAPTGLLSLSCHIYRLKLPLLRLLLSFPQGLRLKETV